jgi:hypothetical protein
MESCLATRKSRKSCLARRFDVAAAASHHAHPIHTSSGGGGYEGDATVLDGGALELDLKGYEGDRVVPMLARFDLAKDGSLRGRVGSLDVRLEPIEASEDAVTGARTEPSPR